MEKLLKGLRKLLVWAILLAIFGMIVFYFSQDLVAFPGRGLYTSNSSEWQARVAALGSQGFLPVDFAGPDGAVIKGIWAPSGTDARPAILWIHAAEQTTTEINQDLKPLTRAGLHVLAMEYRGYGVSAGQTTEANLLADGDAAIEWMLKKEGVAGKRVFVGGLGLGANVALKIAARNPVHGVIAVNPEPDMATAVAAKIPFAPLAFLLKEKFDLAPDLAAVQAPVFLVHGTEDKVVSLARIEEISSKMGVTVRLREVPGAGHLDALERGGNELSDEIDLFKDRPR